MIEVFALEVFVVVSGLSLTELNEDPNTPITIHLPYTQGFKIPDLTENFDLHYVHAAVGVKPQYPPFQLTVDVPASERRDLADAKLFPDLRKLHKNSDLRLRPECAFLPSSLEEPGSLARCTGTASHIPLLAAQVQLKGTWKLMAANAIDGTLEPIGPRSPQSVFRTVRKDQLDQPAVKLANTLILRAELENDDALHVFRDGKPEDFWAPHKTDMEYAIYQQLCDNVLACRVITIINHRYCTPWNCRGMNNNDDADLHFLQVYRLLEKVYDPEEDKFDHALLPPKGPVMPYPYGTYSFSGQLLPESVPAGHLHMMTASSPRCYGAILR